MSNNSLNESLEKLTEDVLNYYDQDVDVEEIAVLTKTPRYLIESILIEQRDVYFR